MSNNEQGLETEKPTSLADANSAEGTSSDEEESESDEAWSDVQ